jgi:selenide,water dikinase
MQRQTAREIVLLGAGHAHVEVLRDAARRPLSSFARLTLITREAQTPYSGLLPALLRGEVTHAQAHIEIPPLAAAAGARLILAAAEAIDLPGGHVVAAGARIPFDLLSIDVGGALPVLPGAIPVKPIGGFLDRLAVLEARLPPGAALAVVGSGAGGTELALALARRLAGRARILLVGRAAEPVAAAPPAARRAVAAALRKARIERHDGAIARCHADGALHLANGDPIPCAAALCATGVAGPAFLAASGLACDAAGCALVDATLRSVGDPRIFAAGDCAAREGDTHPKAGVWAVRAGPPLAANLRRAAAGEAPRAWTPHHEALAILGLGGGRAVAWRGGLSFAGRLPSVWKAGIDRRWIARYSFAPTGQAAS